MWEVAQEGTAATPRHLTWRELPAEEPDISSHRLEVEVESLTPAMEIYFADPEESFSSTVFRSPVRRPSVEELKRSGYHKRIIARRTIIPPADAKDHILAFVLQLRKEGKWWRHQQLADLIQIQATVGEQAIQFEAVPNFRQILFQWCPWLVFKTRMSPEWSGKELRAAINAYLPPEVECREDVWVVPQWWE
jgi:hypothetical protein